MSEPKPKLRPGTVKHFERWAKDLVLDSGEPFRPEPFQLAIVKDVLSGKRATWVVIPQGNGKTTLMAALALYALDPVGWGQTHPMIVVAAATRDQAAWLYQQASSFVKDSPRFAKRFVCQEGNRRIKIRENKDEPGGARGRIQIWAADDKNADGAIFTLGIIDELHNHRDLRLWRRWRGKLRKRDGQLVAISTAGVPGSDFEETRSALARGAAKITKKGAHIRGESPDAVIHDWAVRNPEHIYNMREVKKANPLRAITVAELRRDSPLEDSTISEEHWKRFTCNIPTRIDGAAVNPADWEACYEADLVGDPTVHHYGGVDLGFVTDCSAIVVIGWESRERRPVVYAKILEPPVKQGQIAKAMVEAQRLYSPVSWAVDLSAGARVMLELLKDGEHPDQGDETFEFVDFPQKATPLADAASRLDEAIRNHWIRHDGDADFRRHVLNAIKKSAGPEAWRYDRAYELRNQGGQPIDALSALSFANAVADQTETEGQSLAIAFA